MGNPNLRRCGDPAPSLNAYQISEIYACKQDPIYFIKNYVKIMSLDKGIIDFKLYDFQEDIVNGVVNNRFTIAKIARQSGKTITTAAVMLWYFIFNKNFKIAMLSYKQESAKKIMDDLKLMYENLPDWMQLGIKVWNVYEIVVENGSKIKASSTTPASARGDSYNIIYLDEFAFVRRSIQEDFYRSAYPTITSGKTTKIVITSTPNGLDLFYQFWDKSVKGKNAYHRIDVDWTKVPGRDEKWKLETIAQTSEAAFRVEFECVFEGSNNTLLSADALRRLDFDDPIQSNGQGLEIYENPIKDNIYIMTVDSARGVGLDYSAFLVFDVTEIPYKVVAKFKSNKIEPLLYPTPIHNIAKLYNNAYILVENNDIGAQVVDSLHYDFEYEFLFSTILDRKGVIATIGGWNSTRGVKTTTRVKSMGCSNLKSLIENDKLIIRDADCIMELSTFINTNGNRYEADDGYNDDLVMCLILFSWLSDTQYFKELTQTYARSKILEDNKKRLEEMMLPIGVVTRGSEKKKTYIDKNGERWNIIS